MTNTLHTQTSTKKAKNMLRREINENITKFKETMEELNLLKRVSQDLKNYRKMIRLKKYD